MDNDFSNGTAGNGAGQGNGQQQPIPPASQPFSQAQGDFSAPTTPPPPPKPSKPANFKLGSKLGTTLRIKVPPHSLNFDEQHFLHLLAGSISLTNDEKSRIVE